MRHYTAAILFLLVALALPPAAPLQAEGLCTTKDSIESCFDRYFQALVPAAETEQNEKLLREPAAPDTGGANLATNKKNLLPLLALSGLLGQGQGQDQATSDGTLVLDLNFLIPGLAKPGSKNAQLQAVVNTDPQISDALRAALPEADRDELAGQLGEKVGDLDDYSIRFTYDHANRSHGRSFALYARRFDALSHAALQPIPPPSLGTLTKFIANNQNLFGETASDEPLSNLPVDKQVEALALVEAQAKEFAGFETRATALLNAAGLATFHKLVDNQPQFHLTAERKLRGPLTGADETSLKVTYEWSAVNLNASMSADCHRSLEADPPAGRSAADCLVNEYMPYVKDNAADIERGNRFSFSGEYVDAKKTTLDPGLAGVSPVPLDAVHKVIVSAGWTRDFDLGGEPVAMDLTAKYEDVSDDPMRQDRGVATLTFTRKFGGIAVPFGIVYANHGEFLTDVDERLSAHLGLRFDAGGKKTK